MHVHKKFQFFINLFNNKQIKNFRLDQRKINDNKIPLILPLLPLCLLFFPITFDLFFSIFFTCPLFLFSFVFASKPSPSVFSTFDQLPTSRCLSISLCLYFFQSFFLIIFNTSLFCHFNIFFSCLSPSLIFTFIFRITILNSLRILLNFLPNSPPSFTFHLIVFITLSIFFLKYIHLSSRDLSYSLLIFYFKYYMILLPSSYIFILSHDNLNYL